jgi:hypothetical protein
MEWEDRVAFNIFVNAFLDGWLAKGETAEVWTHPGEPVIRGTNNRGTKRFWIRQDNVPRKRYDWQDGQPRRWDYGSPSQFADDGGEYKRESMRLRRRITRLKRKALEAVVAA